MSDDYNYGESGEQEGNNKIPQNYSNEGNGLKKKNRTLQYYKFLFYSMKTEIKLHDFVKLVRASNASEIAIWVISLILYACTPKDFPKLNCFGSTSSDNTVKLWDGNSLKCKYLFFFFY